MIYFNSIYINVLIINWYNNNKFYIFMFGESSEWIFVVVVFVLEFIFMFV